MRLLKGTWVLLKEAVTAWINDSAPRLGASLSYYTIFAISPMFVIIVFIASLWFSQQAVRGELFGQLAQLVGDKGAVTLERALTASMPKDQGMLATLLAVSALLITSTGLFMELQRALNSIFGVEPKPGASVRTFIIGRLLSFAMIVAIGFLLLVMLVISALLSALGKYLSALVPGLDVLWQSVNTLVSFAVITVLFAIIFKVLPDVRIAWRDVWVGAVVTSILFSLGKFLLGLYLGKNAAVSAYGAAGSVVLILLWVYYSAQILFFGAEVTQVYANRFGQHLQPKPNAQWKVLTPPASVVQKQVPSDPPRPDRKTELLNELRQGVDELRAVVDDSRAKRARHKSNRRETDSPVQARQRSAGSNPFPPKKPAAAVT